MSACAQGVGLYCGSNNALITRENIAALKCVQTKRINRWKLVSPPVQSGRVVPASLWQSFPSQWSWGGGSCQYEGAPLWRWMSCDIAAGCDDLQTLSGALEVRQIRPPTSAAKKVKDVEISNILTLCLLNHKDAKATSSGTLGCLAQLNIPSRSFLVPYRETTRLQNVAVEVYECHNTGMCVWA